MELESTGIGGQLSRCGWRRKIKYNPKFFGLGSWRVGGHVYKDGEA